MAEFDLGKKVGPLPMGAWIAVIGGGLAIAYFINRNQSSGEESQVPLTPQGVGQGGQFVPTTPPDDGEQDETPEDTNILWGQRVSNWLISQGNDPGISANAVQKYLVGEDLTSREQALINMALVRFGAPPEPLPPTNVPPGGDESGDLDPEPHDDPQVVVTTEPTSVQRGKSVTAIGRAWYQNRNTPSGVRTVTVTVWNSNYRPGTFPVSRYKIRTDEGGRFRTKLGWTNPDRGNKYRYYTFSWQGVQKTRRVRIV